MVEVDRGPSFASRMILGGKYAPSTVLEHPRRHAVARADIQRDARLNLARDELDGSTDTLAHMVGDSLAGAEAIATGYWPNLPVSGLIWGVEWPNSGSVSV